MPFNIINNSIESKIQSNANVSNLKVPLDRLADDGDVPHLVQHGLAVLGLDDSGTAPWPLLFQVGLEALDDSRVGHLGIHDLVLVVGDVHTDTDHIIAVVFARERHVGGQVGQLVHCGPAAQPLVEAQVDHLGGDVVPHVPAEILVVWPVGFLTLG